MRGSRLLLRASRAAKEQSGRRSPLGDEAEATQSLSLPILALGFRLFAESGSSTWRSPMMARVPGQRLCRGGGPGGSPARPEHNRSVPAPRLMFSEWSTTPSGHRLHVAEDRRGEQARRTTAATSAGISWPDVSRQAARLGRSSSVWRPTAITSRHPSFPSRRWQMMSQGSVRCWH
jgi:hypothetical protein